MSKKRNFIYCFLIVTILFNLTIGFADTKVDELKKKKDSTTEEIKDKKEKIKALEGQTKDVSVEIEKLDKEMDLAVIELDKVKEDLKQLNINIEQTVKELEEAEENIDEKQDAFNSRLRVMYKNGNVGYLEVLLSSANIGDFLSRKEMIQSIANHDVDLLKYMKEQRNIIDKKNTELRAQRASVQASKSHLEKKEMDLAKATRSKENLMRGLEKDLKTAEIEHDNLNKLAKSIESEIVKRQRVTTPYSGGVMGWPVPGHTRVSSPFGNRIHPIFNTNKFHSGIDIPAPTGTNVVAASDGTVIYSGTLGGYGKTIMVDHGGGVVTLYGHNSSLTVGEGARVSRGSSIARVGSTGYSTGPHVHFEVRKNGSYVDPISWLRGN